MYAAVVEKPNELVIKEVPTPKAGSHPGVGLLHLQRNG